MKRTDPEVRQYCREHYGPDWYADKALKKQRQDCALRALSKTAAVSKTTTTPTVKTTKTDASAADDKKLLERLVHAKLPHLSIRSIHEVNKESFRTCFDALKGSFSNQAEVRWLFHGTTRDAAEKITSSGFNRSYCGRNATIYGRGVYFAKDIRYSAQSIYSPVDARGVKTILAARVLIGNARLGTPDMIEPGADDARAYQTTVNNPTDPSIYVVYKDFQAIPEYVIELEDALR